jgi:DNA polymerase-4
MAKLGIHTGADLRRQSLGFLEAHFGKSAAYLHGACRGIDERPVRADRQRKSIGGERTYAEDLVGADALHAALEEIVDIVWERIVGHRATGRTVTLKLRYADFRQITRARSLPRPVDGRADFARLGHALLESTLPAPLGVRLLGLTLSGLVARETMARGPTPSPAAGVAEVPRQTSLDF